MLEKDIEQILFTKEEIENRCAELGKQISEDYKDKKPLIIGVLRGCVPFMERILENLDIYCTVDFIKVSSYEGTNSTGTLIIKQDITTSLVDKEIILVEDIVDTGLTIKKLIPLLYDRGAKDVKVCTLLHKTAREKYHNDLDYIGFFCEDHFVVGFGLDYNEYYRNLPYIGILKKEIYNN